MMHKAFKYLVSLVLLIVIGWTAAPITLNIIISKNISGLSGLIYVGLIYEFLILPSLVAVGLVILYKVVKSKLVGAVNFSQIESVSKLKVILITLSGFFFMLAIVMNYLPQINPNVIPIHYYYIGLSDPMFYMTLNWMVLLLSSALLSWLLMKEYSIDGAKNSMAYCLVILLYFGLLYLINLIPDVDSFYSMAFNISFPVMLALSIFTIMIAIVRSRTSLS
ncbi:MAG: hypothetical protein WCK26_02825 [Candidatus Saccharibacteria bacterium]